MKLNLRISVFSILIFGVFLMFMTACSKDDNNNPEVKDIDGNIYHTVKIGEQVWMVENLKVTKYRNGDSIPNVSDGQEWSTLTTGAYCNYNNDTSLGDKYGKLYNWYAVTDIRNIAPFGWHVPTDTEWARLESNVASSLSSSGSVAKALASGSDWTFFVESGSPGNDLTQNNSSGFTALPGGYRLDGSFSKIGDYAGWWSSTESFTNNAWLRVLLFSYNSSVTLYQGESNGFSIRCVQD